MKLSSFAYAVALIGWTLSTLGLMLARDGHIGEHGLDVLAGISLSLMLLIVLSCVFSLDAEKKRLEKELSRKDEAIAEIDENDEFGPGWFRS